MKYWFKKLLYLKVLIDTCGSPRGRVNEARSAERKKITVSSGTSREPYQTVSTVYFILVILRTYLWSQGRQYVFSFNKIILNFSYHCGLISVSFKVLEHKVRPWKVIGNINVVVFTPQSHFSADCFVVPSYLFVLCPKVSPQVPRCVVRRLGTLNSKLVPRLLGHGFHAEKPQSPKRVLCQHFSRLRVQRPFDNLEKVHGWQGCKIACKGELYFHPT